MKKTKYNKVKIPIWLYKLPVIMLTAIVPLILLIKAYPIPEPVQKVFGKVPYLLELYHYYKMFFTVIAGIIMLLILLYDIFNDPKPFVSFIKRNKYIYMIFTLVSMVVISSMASKYSYIVIWGFPDRYEGFMPIMTYYITSMYIPYIFRKLDISLTDILKYLMISGCILSIIGILEYFGYRIVSQPWFADIAKITLNPNLIGGDININFTFPPKTVASTLYNPNYVGSYMAMNIFATLAYISHNKDIKYIKLCYIPIFIFSVVLVMSNSAAGLIATFISMVIFEVMILLKNGKKKIVTIAVFMLSILFIFSIVQEMTSPSTGIVRNIITQYNNYDENQGILYKNFKFKDNTLSITYSDINFTMTYDNDNHNLEFIDYNGNPLITYVEEGTNTIKFSDDLYSEFMFNLIEDNSKGILKVGNLSINIAFTEEGLAMINSYGDALYEYTDVKSVAFNGSERFATNRGYLWSRSIPILMENFILGVGPDCYAMEFPQDDIIGKINFYGSQNVFVDKPHNLYLQTSINQGMISLIAFLVLMFIPVVKLFKDLIITPYKVHGYRLLLICSQISYMAAGMANDSTVSIGPVFWSIVGLNLYIMNKE